MVIQEKASAVHTYVCMNRDLFEGSTHIHTCVYIYQLNIMSFCARLNSLYQKVSQLGKKLIMIGKGGLKIQSVMSLARSKLEEVNKWSYPVY